MLMKTVVVVAGGRGVVDEVVLDGQLLVVRREDVVMNDRREHMLSMPDVRLRDRTRQVLVDDLTFQGGGDEATQKTGKMLGFNQ